MARNYAPTIARKPAVCGFSRGKPPNSWIAIASVAGARNWGTQPDSDELQTLLESQVSLLRSG
jgi:hypothetical protein